MDNSKTKQVIKVDRVLNIESAQKLKGQLLSLFEGGVFAVELDFSDTVEIDSSGLGKLLLFNEKFTEAGRSFSLTQVRHQELTRLFRLINLEKTIQIDYQEQNTRRDYIGR